MGSWGKVDYKEFERFQKKLEKLQNSDLDKFCRDCSKELAARLLSLVIPATPVGSYPKSTGKKGGTLRRGWTAGVDAKSSAEVTAYAASLPIYQNGDNFTIVVKNPVEYASYVEFGHRTRSGGWVEGQLFMTKAEAILEARASGFLEKKLEQKLKEVFNG